MTLLAILAARAAEQTPPVTPEPEPNTIPYPFPTSAPYNVPMYTVTPTDDGTGHSIHPSVLDFGNEGWNGHRFWMTTTAYFNAENSRENPHVYHSDDGFHWEWPEGVVNPLDPWPGAAENNANWYNSDSHLAYDPDTNQLVLTWREVRQQSGGKQTIWARTSADGSTWTPEVKVHEITDDGGRMWSTSQGLVRMSANEWRMYFAGGGAGSTPGWDRYFTATNPLGPYSNPTVITYSGPGTAAYHGDWLRLEDGRILCLFQQDGREYPGLSTDDGLTFTTRPHILQGGYFGGNQQAMYKSAMAIDQADPSKVGVWYTTHGAWGRWICYTRVPLTAWIG